MIVPQVLWMEYHFGRHMYLYSVFLIFLKMYLVNSSTPPWMINHFIFLSSNEKGLDKDKEQYKDFAWDFEEVKRIYDSFW
jgi:hypothetical protein